MNQIKLDNASTHEDGATDLEAEHSVWRETDAAVRASGIPVKTAMDLLEY